MSSSNKHPRTLRSTTASSSASASATTSDSNPHKRLRASTLASSVRSSRHPSPSPSFSPSDSEPDVDSDPIEMTHEETIDWHRRLLAAWLKLANGGKGLRVGDAALIKGWKALTIESGEEAHWGDESKRHFEDLKNLYECVFEVEALEGWELREVEGEGGKSWKLVPESDDADAAGAAWERLKGLPGYTKWLRDEDDNDFPFVAEMTKVFEVIAAKKAGFPASAPAEASMDVQPQPVQTPDEARDAPMPDGNFIPEAPNPLHQRLASIQESIDSLHDESTACTAALEKLTLNADTLTHQQKAIATKMDQLLETQKDLKTLVMGNIEGAGNA